MLEERETWHETVLWLVERLVSLRQRRKAAMTQTHDNISSPKQLPHHRLPFDDFIVREDVRLIWPIHSHKAMPEKAVVCQSMGVIVLGAEVYIGLAGMCKKISILISSIFPNFTHLTFYSSTFYQPNHYHGPSTYVCVLNGMNIFGFATTCT